VRALAWTVALVEALACSRTSSAPAPPDPTPAAAASSAPELAAPVPEASTWSQDGIECDNGHDPHPAPVDGGGLSLSQIGGVGGGPCWFSDIHGEIVGDVDPATRAVGRAACPTFDKLRDCYTEARGPQKKDHIGFVDVTLAVGPDGSVTDAHAEHTTVGDARLTACVVATLHAVRPGPDASGRRYTYDVRFVRRESLGVCAGR